MSNETKHLWITVEFAYTVEVILSKITCNQIQGYSGLLIAQLYQVYS